MLDQILLNWKPYILSEDKLPCLITYGKNMGGSHLSITLISQLFTQGSKILFMTAYPMAKDNFLNQIGQNPDKIIYMSSIDELENSPDTQVIIIESGNAILFQKALDLLPDINERVIFIKNIEIFNEEIFDACIKHEKVIISGNIDECNFKNKFIETTFKTIIAFNQPESLISIEVPKLEKWSSFLTDQDQNGILTITPTQSTQLLK